MSIRLEKARALGTCYSHPDRRVVPGKTQCQECLDAMKARYYLAKKNGKCNSHPNRDARPGQTYCEECVSQRRKRSEEKKRRNVCVRHPGRAAEPRKTYCIECLMRQREWNLARKIRAFESLGGARCVCCGETQIEFLSIEHAKGNGSRLRKLDPGQRSGAIHTWVARQNQQTLRAAGLEVLCMNCQFGRRSEGGCPHQR